MGGRSSCPLTGSKKKLERQTTYLTLTNPSALITELRHSGQGSRFSAPDEEYLQLIVAQILPDYFGLARNDGTGVALRQIAVEFQHRHHDDWLRDVLQLHRSPAAKLSFLAVAKAAQALDAEDSATAEAQAIAAIKLFRSEGTMPGLLLAQLQHVAALQLQSRYAECAKASEPLTQSLQHYNYPWLHTLALLEQGTCQTWAHEFDQGGRQYNEALALAETSSYPVLRLRTFGLRANRQQVFVGSTADAWKNGAKGLSQYWDGLYPPSRVRDLYSVYASLAESMNLKQAGIQWTKELTYIALLLQRKDLYAICMYLLATAENAADLYPDAVRHLNEASSLHK
ncbi:MAG: hypothetical protein U0Q18_01420 [Bryobacteraceae bacterium]